MTGQKSFTITCPYSQRNPKRFNARDHPNCIGADYFTSFSQLRQHIAQHHVNARLTGYLPLCHRCGASFFSQDNLNAHFTMPELRCKQRHWDPEDGVDQGTLDQVQSRWQWQGLAPADQYADLCRMLFPGDRRAMRKVVR